MSIGDMARGQTATLYRKSTTPDTQGGHVDVWSAIYSDVTCNIQPKNAKMGGGNGSGIRTERDRREMDISHRLYTTTALTLLTGDKVVVGSNTYHVQSFGDAAGKGRLYYVDLLQKS